MWMGASSSLLQTYHWPASGVSGGTSLYTLRPLIACKCITQVLSHACFSNSVLIHNDALHLMGDSALLPRSVRHISGNASSVHHLGVGAVQGLTQHFEQMSMKGKPGAQLLQR